MLVPLCFLVLGIFLTFAFFFSYITLIPGNDDAFNAMEPVSIVIQILMFITFLYMVVYRGCWGIINWMFFST